MLPNRKSKDNKVACVIYYYGEKYSFLGQNAVNSFSNFHPDVDLYVLNNITIDDFLYKKAKQYPDPIKAYVACHFLMNKMGYEKAIKVGGDTITCDRLDAFLDDMDTTVDQRVPILATLDFWGYQPYLYAVNDNVEHFAGPRAFVEKDNLQLIPTRVCGYADNLDQDEGFVKEMNLTVESKRFEVYESLLKEVPITGMISCPSLETIPKIKNFLNKYFRFNEEEYEEMYKNKNLALDSMGLNADIICFNNPESLLKIIKIFTIYVNIHNMNTTYINLFEKFRLMCYDLPYERRKEIYSAIEGKNLYGTLEEKTNFINNLWNNIASFHFYWEQGALNIYNFLYGKDNIKIVDITNETSECYNVRGFGTASQKNKTKYLKDFYIKDNKLYNHCDRQIKIFHYCANIGANEELKNSNNVKEALDEIFHSLFSKDVISFLKKQCKCENIM